MNSVILGFEKAAGIETIVPKLVSGFKSMGAQLAAGGARIARSGVAAGASLGKSPLGKDLVNRGATSVGNRIRNRALIGAAVGAGGSMVQQKMKGEDVSVGRAVAGGALGAGVGAALGTTAGARGFRRLTSPASTPNLNFAKSVNPMGWAKKAPDVTTKLTGGRSIVTKGRTAFGAMSPIDKGFLGLSAVDALRASTDKKHEGHRGEAIGGAVGNAAAMMAGSRWAGLRSGRKGSLMKSVGLYTGGSMAGARIGKAFDRPQEVQGA